MADAILWRTQAAGVEWYLEFFPNGVKSVCLADRPGFFVFSAGQ